MGSIEIGFIYGHLENGLYLLVVLQWALSMVTTKTGVIFGIHGNEYCLLLPWKQALSVYFMVTGIYVYHGNKLIYGFHGNGLDLWKL